MRRAELMRCAQGGDRSAYGALLEESLAILTTLFRRRLSDPRDVEDVCQETLIAVHRARHSYDASRPFEPWLVAIAGHVLADHVRRRVRRRPEILVAIPPETVGEGDGAAEFGFEQALARLPGAQREAFTLIQVEGLPVEAAAARANTSTAALKVRAHRAYRALRDSLRRA
jgi:RNA polymerase sigma-70 factor (ECF subfamily)